MFYKHDNGFLRLNTKFVQGGPTEFNPLNLPPHTIRVRTSDGNVPIKGDYTSYETATLVPGTTDVYDVFKNGQSFASLLYGSNNMVEILGANTKGITDMKRMFRDCSSLSTVPLFDTSKVTDMTQMFYFCTSLTNITLFDTSSVTNMGSMLDNCTALQSVPLFDTSNVTSMNSMFHYCTSLTTVPLFDTSNVTDMGGMFSLCTSLTNIPLFNTTKVTYMSDMFKYCSSLTNIPLFNTSKVRYMDYMFRECRLVQSGALALYQQASTQANPPSYHTKTFYACGSNTQTGAAELAQIPRDWK